MTTIRTLDGNILLGFEEADLYNGTLENANFEYTNLYEANFGGANLSGTKFVGTHLVGADLTGATLVGANLSGTKFVGTHLVGADLTGATLVGADLRLANLENTNLRGANLEGADLTGADLTGADLTGADLRLANLENANLMGADLEGANLEGAKLEGAKLPCFEVAPKTGSFRCFKKVEKGYVLELEVPEDAVRVSSLVGRKCRCSKAKIVDVSHVDPNFGEIITTEFHSLFKRDFVYRLGEWVEMNLDDDIRVECASGIHFFMTKEEAISY
jgi:hypothetical protein